MSNASPAQERHFSFSLGDLFKLVFALAIAFAALSDTNLFGLSELLMLLEGCVVFGLACQAWDLSVAYHRAPLPPPEERAGWLFATTWRIALCLMIVIGITIEQLKITGLLVFMEREGDEGDVFYPLVSAAVRLAVIFAILSGTPPVETAGAPSRARRVLRILGWAGFCAFAIAYLRDQTAILKLVFVALIGIEASQPAFQYSFGAMKDIDPNVAIRSLRFVLSSLPAAICLLISFVVFSRFIRRWNRTGRPNRLLLFALLAAWFPTIIYPVWVARSGMRRLSPALAEGQLPVPLYTWVAAFIVIAVVVIAGAHRLTSVQTSTSTTWRRSCWRYLHERRTVLLLLLLATGIPVCKCNPLPTLLPENGPGRHAIINWELFYLVRDLTIPLVCVLSVALYRRAVYPNSLVDGPPAKLRMTRFVATGLLLFALLVGAVGTGAGFSFALSLVP